MQVTFLPHVVQLRIVRHPLASAQLAGTPSKRGGTQIEGQVEQQQQRLRAAAHPLLAEVDSRVCKLPIRRLFDASIVPEDSAFRDLVGDYAR
jgi:hypothetical protein